MRGKNLASTYMVAGCVGLAAVGCAQLIGADWDSYRRAGGGGNGAPGVLGGDDIGGGGGDSGGGGGACEAGKQIACYDGDSTTEGVGLCKAGTRPCEDPTAVCSGQVLPAEENCAAEGDENCDGRACGDVTWATSHGDSASHKISDIGTDQYGNIYILGEFQGSLTFGHTKLTASGERYPYGNTNGDAYLAKLSPNGTPLWAKSYKAAWPVGLDVTSDGDVGASIFISQDAPTDVEGSTASGLVVFRLAPDGSRRWINPCGGNAGSETSRRGDVSFGPYEDLFILEVVRGGCLATSTEGARVARFNKTGELIWSETMSTSSYSRLGGIAASKTSGAFATFGNTDTAAGVFMLLDRSYGDRTLIEFEEYPHWPVTSDGFGGAVIAGEFTGSISVDGQTRTGFTDRDLFVARFSFRGQLMWLTILPSLNVTGVAVAGDGIFLTGTFSEPTQFGDTNLIPGESGSLWLGRLSLGSNPSAAPGGTPQWARSYMGSFDAPKVAANSTGVYLATGFYENVNFSGRVLTSSGDSDVAVVHFDP